MFDIKYRPQTFDDVLGNSTIVDVLRYRSIKKSWNSRSIMFGGPKGTGKTTLARIIAKSMGCGSLENGNPCNKCSYCIDVDTKQNSSIQEFDAASGGTVDRIREIVNNTQYETVDGNPHIVILDEAHRLGPASQDALLTAMEDRRLVAILCTTEPNKIRPALRDRVDEFMIRYPTLDALTKRLVVVCKNESVNSSEEVLYKIAESSDCCPRVALNALFYLVNTNNLEVRGVDEYFLTTSLAVIRGALSDLIHNRPAAIKGIVRAVDMDGPSFVKDSILSLVSSAIRMSCGLPVKSSLRWSYAANELPVYIALGKSLSLIDKPTAADVVVTISSFDQHLSVEVHASNIVKTDGAPQKPLESPKKYTIERPSNDMEKVTVTGAAAIEINGVKFNMEERITKLHDKIDGPRGPMVSSIADDAVSRVVELDKTRIPMSEQEFSRAFTNRFR